MEKATNEITWNDGDVTTRSPEVIGEAGQLTIALFLIVAVAAITLLFALGIFIDCRHQKIDDEEAQRRKDHRKMKFKIPKIMKKVPKRDDKDCIIENMEEEASTSNSIV